MKTAEKPFRFGLLRIATREQTLGEARYNMGLEEHVI
jgi:hypothetical protein